MILETVRLPRPHGMDRSGHGGARPTRRAVARAPAAARRSGAAAGGGCRGSRSSSGRRSPRRPPRPGSLAALGRSDPGAARQEGQLLRARSRELEEELERVTAEWQAILDWFPNWPDPGMPDDVGAKALES
jgi:hypothetical protein